MSVAKDPVVSVNMPVWNNERFVGEAIESILDQSFCDFEFLILDDGSTDRTPEILRGYAAQDDRIRLWIEPHRGVVPARNDLIDRSRGTFIAIMDADDVSLPLRFERQLEYLGRHADCAALGSRVLVIDADGDPLCDDFLDQTHEQIDGKNIQGRGSAVCNPSAMMRRQAVLDVGKYD
jgi:glycosyltransferase involved in cell wall biosynthesis